MNVERALKTEGWLALEEVEYLARLASKSERIVEIGSWKGKSTVALASNTPGHVTAVDTFEGSEEQKDFDEDSIFTDFLANTEGLPVTALRMRSVDAAKLLGGMGLTFDLIFIDAMHKYEDVKQDIIAWLPLLSADGVICGHDYGGEWDGVKKAVDELIPKFRIVWSIWTTEGK